MAPNMDMKSSWRSWVEPPRWEDPFRCVHDKGTWHHIRRVFRHLPSKNTYRKGRFSDQSLMTHFSCEAMWMPSKTSRPHQHIHTMDVHPTTARRSGEEAEPRRRVPRCICLCPLCEEPRSHLGTWQRGSLFMKTAGT